MFPAEPIPDKIGSYRIIRRLSGPGSYDMYLGRAEGPMGFQRDVALKVMPDTSEGNTQFAEEMAREAAICSRLNHPAIVRVVDFFEQTGRMILVLEHLEGQTLEQLLQHLASKHEKLSDAAAFYIVQQIAGALAYAHSAIDENDKPTPIIHRNIHPDNILVSEDGEVRLTGFGVGKILGRTPDTAIGKIKGTPGYMAPEQARGEPVTAKADVWGLGIVLWSLLVNTRPPTDGTWPRKIKGLRNDLPKEIVAIIDAALDPFPGTRKITSREMEQWLSKVANPKKGQADLKEHVAAMMADVAAQEQELPVLEGRTTGRSTDPGLGNPFLGVRFGPPSTVPKRPSTAAFKAVTLDRDTIPDDMSTGEPKRASAAQKAQSTGEGSPEPAARSAAVSPSVAPSEPLRRSSTSSFRALAPIEPPDRARRPSTSSFKAVTPPPAATAEPEAPEPEASPSRDPHRARVRPRRRVDTPSEAPKAPDERVESASMVVSMRVSTPAPAPERASASVLDPTPPPVSVRPIAPVVALPVASPPPPAVAPAVAPAPEPAVVTPLPELVTATPPPASLRFGASDAGLTSIPDNLVDPAVAGRRPLSAAGSIIVSAVTALVVVALALYLFWPGDGKGPTPAGSASASAPPPSSAPPVPVAPPPATATATATAVAAPSVNADTGSLPYGFGYLTVVSPAAANVYVFGKLYGPVNTPLKVRCGRFFIRLATPAEGKYPEWVTAGQTVDVACQQNTRIEMKP